MSRAEIAQGGVRMVGSTTGQRRPVGARASDASNGRETSGAVDYAALARFRYELRKFQAFSKAAADQAGLTPQQHQALLTIRGFFPTRTRFPWATSQNSC